MTKLTHDQLRLGANTLRMLAVDAIEKANSGHPGLPMGAADYAFILWHDFLSFNPNDPNWPNRDRFILSAGHGSMLLYGLLHLFGFDLPMEQLQNFRQWGSATPGHPEAGHTPGVEVTTGPLGQGFANGVGMGIAARMVADRFNDEACKLIDHKIYALVSDGDLMEGISSEAASLAGHLKLGNLIYIYDDNGITIEGSTELAFSEDIKKRFEACGWYVQRINGHDYEQIRDALDAARHEKEKPSLIIAKTHIACGSPNKHDSPQAHGSPLGPQEVTATCKNLNWPVTPFYIPPEVADICRQRVEALKANYEKWQQDFEAWRKRSPSKAALWDRMQRKDVPADIAKTLLVTVPPEAAATRSLSGKALQKIAELVPSLAGGSADLSPSTNTDIKNSQSIGADAFNGRNLHFGIREHAMGAMINGMARYGFFIPYGSTFLVFSDYCRPAIRLSALMKQQVIYVFTHDSIFLGEDGPTHQPVEQLSALRLIPGLAVIRPADAVEVAMAWAAALQKKDGPTALILTRQKVPVIQRRTGFSPDEILRGGYIVSEFGAIPKLTILATGSEVGLAVDAAKLLLAENIPSRVVSVPCLENFLNQPEDYKNSVLGNDAIKVAVEAGRGALWHQLTGDNELVIGIETFGASAPDKVLAEKYGLTPALVAERIKAHLNK